MTNAFVAQAMEKHLGIKPKHETDPKKADLTGHKKGEKDEPGKSSADSSEDGETA